ncbi:MAG: ATP synthase F1 subunit delta [Pseudomonadota bacterium]
MISTSMTRRYAEALISIGIEEDSREKFEAELTKVKDTLEENTELRNVIYSPAYPIKDKKGILKEVAKRLEVSKNIENFLSLLIDKKRIEFLPHILIRYREILDQTVGRIRAKVIIARNLPEELVSNLKASLEKLSGKKVELEIEKDPTILGGVITKLGNIIFDGSIRTQLEKVKKSIVRGEEG